MKRNLRSPAATDSTDANRRQLPTSKRVRVGKQNNAGQSAAQIIINGEEITIAPTLFAAFCALCERRGVDVSEELTRVLTEGVQRDAEALKVNEPMSATLKKAERIIANEAESLRWSNTNRKGYWSDTVSEATHRRYLRVAASLRKLRVKAALRQESITEGQRERESWIRAGRPALAKA